MRVEASGEWDQNSCEWAKRDCVKHLYERCGELKDERKVTSTFIVASSIGHNQYWETAKNNNNRQVCSGTCYATCTLVTYGAAKKDPSGSGGGSGGGSDSGGTGAGTGGGEGGDHGRPKAGDGSAGQGEGATKGSSGNGATEGGASGRDGDGDANSGGGRGGSGAAGAAPRKPTATEIGEYAEEDNATLTKANQQYGEAWQGIASSAASAGGGTTNGIHGVFNHRIHLGVGAGLGMTPLYKDDALIKQSSESFAVGFGVRAELAWWGLETPWVSVGVHGTGTFGFANLLILEGIGTGRVRFGKDDTIAGLARYGWGYRVADTSGGHLGNVLEEFGGGVRICTSRSQKSPEFCDWALDVWAIYQSSSDFDSKEGTPLIGEAELGGLGSFAFTAQVAPVYPRGNSPQYKGTSPSSGVYGMIGFRFLGIDDFSAW